MRHWDSQFNTEHGHPLNPLMVTRGRGRKRDGGDRNKCILTWTQYLKTATGASQGGGVPGGTVFKGCFYIQEM